MNAADAPHALAVRYAQIVDNREFERMIDIMCADFTQQGPGFSAGSVMEFIAGLAFLENYSATFHLLGQQSGEWEGDVYRGETYCVASHIHEKSGVPHKLDMGIRYSDHIVLDGAHYKYQSRDLNVVYVQDLPLEMSQ